MQNILLYTLNLHINRSQVVGEGGGGGGGGGSRKAQKGTHLHRVLLQV